LLDTDTLNDHQPAAKLKFVTRRKARWNILQEGLAMV